MVFLPAILVFAGCGMFSADAGQKGAGGEADTFIAAEWNVQALFDGQETGNEYREFLEAAGWTAEKYAARITAISQAVPRMVQPAANAPVSKTAVSRTTVPDLIGFVEVENAGVLEDLSRGALSQFGYRWNVFTALPGSSLGIGVLSRFPITEARTHSITVGKETAPRPVLEVRVEPRGKPLVFLLCHWKSKLGNDSATEALRRSSARVIQRRLRELRETEAETPVVVMGDLNENHDEFNRNSGTVFCALLPDTPGAAALAKRNAGSSQEFLVLDSEKPPRAMSFSEDVSALYSPWGKEMTGGSYYYRDDWETIDHFLLSAKLFDGSGWNFDSCQVLNHEPFTGSNGAPDSYVPRTGRGLSDHLPLLLYLRDLTPETGKSP